jgi:hypothetical protein
MGPPRSFGETRLTFSSPTAPGICGIIGGKIGFISGVTRMPRIPYLRATILAVAIAAAGAPAVQAQDSSLEGAQQEAVEGLSKLLNALGMFVKSVPQFSAPEMLPNGDIIIRRIHPDQAPTPETPKRNDDESTST